MICHRADSDASILQMPLEEKARRSKLVIDNNGSLEELQSKVRLCMQILAAPLEACIYKLQWGSSAADGTAARCAGASSQWCAEAAQHIPWAAQQPTGHRIGTDGDRAQSATLCSPVLAQAMARTAPFYTNTILVMQGSADCRGSSTFSLTNTSYTAAGYNLLYSDARKGSPGHEPIAFKAYSFADGVLLSSD
jgi:hypothetical protein